MNHQLLESDHYSAGIATVRASPIIYPAALLHHRMVSSTKDHGATSLLPRLVLLTLDPLIEQCCV